MTAKEYLLQVSKINERLPVMAERLKRLRSAAEYISPQLDSTKTTTRNVHAMESAVIRIVELEELIHAEYERLADASATVGKLTEPKHEKILMLRYFDNKKWVNIADDLQLSERQVRRIHEEAVEALEAVLKIDRLPP